MRSGNSPTLDDNNRWRCGLAVNWLKYKRSIICCFGLRCRRGKVLVVRMAQYRDVVANYQDKFLSQPCQRTALQSMAGTAKQLKWIIC